MAGKWHLGGRIHKKTDQSFKYNDIERTMLSNKNHDLSKPIGQGPRDIGFDESYITSNGVQSPPYAFLHNSKFIEKTFDNITYWAEGNYSMPEGISRIGQEGEGAGDWDASAYNMILVNETEKFLDMHLQNQADKPFFSYVALGSVHTPHSPPNKFLDGSPVAGQYDTRHKDMLLEMDMVVGSLIKLLEDRNLVEDTIIIFSSDNGVRSVYIVLYCTTCYLSLLMFIFLIFINLSIFSYIDLIVIHTHTGPFERIQFKRKRSPHWLSQR